MIQPGRSDNLSDSNPTEISTDASQRLWDALEQETQPAQPPVHSRAPLPPIGDLLGGRFLVRGFLGGGGMGLVYEGEDQNSGERVAMKTPRPGCSRPEMLRFIREAALVLPEHPSLVGTVARFVEDSRPYHIQELIPGRSLQEILQARAEHQGALHPSERTWFAPDKAAEVAARAIADMARGLEVLHRSGILHRDLKPANLVWHEEGRAVLVDFGLALQEQGAQSSMSQIAGTSAYMAPEQWRNQDVDARTDIFALGATLWHLLTGHPPEGMPRGGQLLGLEQEIPEGLVAVVQKALEVHPRHRYNSAQEFAEAIEGWLGLRPPHPGLQRKTTRARRWATRHRFKLALGAASLVLLSSLYLGGVLIRTRTAKQEAMVGLTSRAVTMSNALIGISNLSEEYFKERFDTVSEDLLSLMEEDPNARSPETRELFRNGIRLAVRTGRRQLALELSRSLGNWQTKEDAELQASALTANRLYEEAAALLREAGGRWPEDKRFPSAARMMSSFGKSQRYPFVRGVPLGRNKLPRGPLMVPGADGSLSLVSLLPNGTTSAEILAGAETLPRGELRSALEIQGQEGPLGWMLYLAEEDGTSLRRNRPRCLYFLNAEGTKLDKVFPLLSGETIDGRDALHCGDVDGDGEDEVVAGIANGRGAALYLDYQDGKWSQTLIDVGGNNITSVHLPIGQAAGQIWLGIADGGDFNRGYRLRIYEYHDQQLQLVDTLPVGKLHNWKYLRGWEPYHSVATFAPHYDTFYFGESYLRSRSGEAWLLEDDSELGLRFAKELFFYPLPKFAVNWPVSAITADLDNNGRDELFLYWQWQQEGFVTSVVADEVDGKLQTLELLLASEAIRHRLADLDGDGIEDSYWEEQREHMHVVHHQPYVDQDRADIRPLPRPGHRRIVAVKGEAETMNGVFDNIGEKLTSQEEPLTLLDARFRLQSSDLGGAAVWKLMDHRGQDFVRLTVFTHGTEYVRKHAILVTFKDRQGNWRSRQSKETDIMPGCWVRIRLQAHHEPEGLFLRVEPDGMEGMPSFSLDNRLPVPMRKVQQLNWAWTSGETPVPNVNRIEAGVTVLDWQGPGNRVADNRSGPIAEVWRWFEEMETLRRRGDADGWKQAKAGLHAIAHPASLSSPVLPQQTVLARYLLHEFGNLSILP